MNRNCESLCSDITDVTVSRNEETENKGGAPTKVKKNVLKPKKEPKLATAVKLNEVRKR